MAYNGAMGNEQIIASQQLVLERLRSWRGEFAQRYTVRRLGIFGSFARDCARADSDLDLMVEFGELTFDHFMDLKFTLEERLGRKVDLVTSDAIKPRLRPIIEAELVDV